jgi:hypothetical protein
VELGLAECGSEYSPAYVYRRTPLYRRKVPMDGSSHTYNDARLTLVRGYGSDCNFSAI